MSEKEVNKLFKGDLGLLAISIISILAGICGAAFSHYIMSRVVWTVLFVGLGVLGFFSLMSYIYFEMLESKEKTRYNKFDVMKELRFGKVIHLDNTGTYLTENFIVFCSTHMHIARYDDIAYIYPMKKSLLTGAMIGVVSEMFSGISGKIILIGITKNGEKLVLGDVFRSDTREILRRIIISNPDVLIGYSKENDEKFSEMCSKYKTADFRGVLFILLIILLCVAGLVFTMYIIK